MGSSRPYPSRSPAHFASIFNDFGGMAVDFLEMPPEMPPQSPGCPGTALDVAGGQNPTFRAIFPGFVAFSERPRASPDVAGSLWKWDGWPPHSGHKRLIIVQKYFCVHFEAPKKARRMSGFLGTFADVGYRVSWFHQEFSIA